jgi:hypothetical protein
VRRGLLIAAWVGCILAATTAAHPIHRSLAEADYRRESGKLEISFQLFADDFEAELSQLAGKAISLAQSPRTEVSDLVRAYLIEHFIVKTREHTLASQRLIGYELKDAANEVWLYLECALPGGVDGVRIAYTALRERFSDQLNSVRVRDGQRQVTLMFLPQQGEQSVRFP